MTLNDFIAIKKCLSEKLMNYQGSVVDKQEFDNAYLAIVEVLNNVKADCAVNNLNFDEVKKVPVSLDYCFDEILIEKMNRDNLTLDF